MSTLATDGTVYLIDDDDGAREALAWLLRTRRLFSESFNSGEAFWSCVEQWSAQGPREPCCAVLDLRMPGMSGLEVFQRILDQEWHEALPVIFLSGHADLPIAVEAVRQGAFDFCQKPFSDNALVSRVTQALTKSAEVLAKRRLRSDFMELVSHLTEREQDVMRLMAQGLLNKLIADQLQISVRTVEVHRAKILDKLRVKSVVELVHVLHEVEFY